MKWLLNALSSSLGRKYLMAITGLLLCGFLVAHLAGNLLLFAGAETYNSYAKALHQNKRLLLVAEIGLFALFVTHILLAFRLTSGNVLARGKAYAVTKHKGEGDGVGYGRPDSFMFVSGMVILGFLVLHLSDFKFGDDSLAPYTKAREVLRTPIRSIAYLSGFAFLFLHLLHGVKSTFQTLGINHKKYNQIIKCCGVLFAASVSLGFASCVGWAWTFDNASPVDATAQQAEKDAPATAEAQTAVDSKTPTTAEQTPDSGNPDGK